MGDFPSNTAGCRPFDSWSVEMKHVCLLEEKSSAELELKAASLPLLESIESDVLKVFAVSNMIVCR